MRRAIAIVVSAALSSLPSIARAPAASASFPGENGTIAFARIDGKHSDIWIVDPQSGRTTRLTRTRRAAELGPDWSPDGTRLLYMRCRSIVDEESCELWVMEADGSAQTRLTPTPDSIEGWGAWSPDGSRIAFVSETETSGHDVWVMDADGGNRVPLTSTGMATTPEWSPDGSRIAFVDYQSGFGDVWVVDADGSSLVRVTSGDRFDEFPDWTPDGSRILFDGDGDLWVVNPDGSHLARLQPTARVFESAPVFSPDGTAIAYNRSSRNGVSIWVMDADGSGPTRVTPGDADWSPDWQPV